jgi:tetratricopeptide (TPR) repeat protein
MFFPVNQNLDYDYPIYRTLFTPPVFFSVLILLLIFGGGIYLLYRSFAKKMGGASEGSGQTFQKSFRITNEPWLWYRLLAFGIFWFFVTLSVESSIIPIADVIVEHRLYLPSVGFFIAFMAGVMVVKDRFRSKGIIVVTMFVLVAGLSMMAYARNMVWRDEVTLWEDTVKKSPQTYRANFNAGLSHAKRGRFNEAIKEFQTAIRINPDYPEVYNNLGLAYLHKGDFDAALYEINLALTLDPRAPYIYDSLGQVYAGQGRYDDARKAFQKALELDPDYTEARTNLGNLYRIINETNRERKND